jgi:predicted nucleotidyltransferase
MISEREKNIILECASKFAIKEVYLFGSALEEGGNPNDIDLAIRGLKEESFYKFYGEIMRKLAKPVDIVDLSIELPFNQLIERRGIKIQSITTGKKS